MIMINLLTKTKINSLIPQTEIQLITSITNRKEVQFLNLIIVIKIGRKPKLSLNSIKSQVQIIKIHQQTKTINQINKHKINILQ